ncbi:MAG: hypothetical protein HZB55_08230 [Deltaproteobacteria bacterium]|nr:hypothetical protein [Deltaproteobacteria bacterium]
MSHSHHRQHPPPAPRPARVDTAPDEGPPRALEVVAKADTRGTLDAVGAAVARVSVPGVRVAVIEASVGDVSQSDLLMATTGSRLVLGFGVGATLRVEEAARQHGVEVRLYELLDRLAGDLQEIAGRLVPVPPGERILGQARVVALFKGTRKGVILGCEVLQGRIAVGMAFRLISAPGPVYTGVVESLHIEADAITQARQGQRVGVRVRDFNRARVGDLMECFASEPSRQKAWAPTPGIVRVRA